MYFFRALRHECLQHRKFKQLLHEKLDQTETNKSKRNLTRTRRQSIIAHIIRSDFLSSKTFLGITRNIIISVDTIPLDSTPMICSEVQVVIFTNFPRSYSKNFNLDSNKNSTRNISKDIHRSYYRNSYKSSFRNFSRHFQVLQ